MEVVDSSCIDVMGEHPMATMRDLNRGVLLTAYAQLRSMEGLSVTACQNELRRSFTEGVTSFPILIRRLPDNLDYTIWNIGIRRINPFSPPSGPAQQLAQGPTPKENS